MSTRESNPDSLGADQRSSVVRRFPLIAPFFLSGFLYLSLLGVVLAPLPLLWFILNGKWLLLGVAVLTNAAVVALMSQPLDAYAYLGVVLVPVLVMGLGLRARLRFEWAILLGFLSFWLALGAFMLGYAQVTGHSIKQVLDQGLTQWVSQLKPSMIQQIEETGDVEMLKRRLMHEIPSSLSILALLSLVMNFSFALSLNWGRLRKTLGLYPGFFRTWKAPEWLVWPTLVLAGAAILGKAPWDVWAQSALKVLLAAYVFQGLSIASFFADRFKIRGLFRSVLFGFLVFMGTPVLVTFGFFDLWFDFRSKMRQSV